MNANEGRGAVRTKKGAGRTKCATSPVTSDDRDLSLVALSLAALSGLAGLRHDFDLGLL